MRYGTRLAGLGIALCAVATVTSACGAGRATTADEPALFAGTNSSSVPAQRPAATAPVPQAPSATQPPVSRPPVSHCAANQAAQAVLVSLRDQHLWLCARHRQVLDTAITSGMVGPDTATPTGRYTIQGLNRDTTLTLNTGATYPVKYWIPFDAPLFGFHDSSWQNFPYGSPRYRTDGSHGCIHMPLPAIRFMYGWAHIGAIVDIAA